ncbi:MAG: hypothetical protein RLZZ127_2146 [Planctomycetota bacterium]
MILLAILVQAGAAADLPPVGARPELLLRPAEAAALRGLDRDPSLRGRLAARIVAEAAAMADHPLPERRMEGRRLLGTSRLVQRRVLTTAMAWLITGERRHADTARRTMLAAAAFRDWNPDHFLDVAEMTAALALGVDWLDGELPPADRAAIRVAIRRHGLEPGARGGWWVTATNNWNQVCHGGLVLGALVLRDEAPDLARSVIDRAIREMPRGLTAYAPDGAYPEGPGYWSYGTTYSMLAAAALHGVCGQDGGITGAPGFLASAQFMIHATGPTGLRFNFADGGPGGADAEPALAWMADRLGEPAVLARAWAAVPEILDRPSRVDGSARRMLPLMLLWPDRHVPDARTQAPATAWRATGPTPIMMMRTGWDADATWVGVKGGSPSANHGHMDAGSVVVDMLGQRWVADLGMEDYGALEAAKIRIWDGRQDGERWTVLRHHVRSHATLMVDGLGQVVSGSAPIIAARLGRGEGHAILDLAPVYAGQLHQARRGVRLSADGSVLVRDEVVAGPDRRIRTAVITGATAAVIAPGLVRLEQAGRTAWLRLDAPADARWEASALFPDRAVENPNRGMSALTVTVPGTGGLQVLQWSLHPREPGGVDTAALASWAAASD